MNSFRELFTIFRLKPNARREALQGLAFISPWIFGFLVFILAPMVATLGFSVSNINLAQEQPLRYVGFDNYRAMLSDSTLQNALGVTVKFAFIALPFGLMIPLAVAMLLNNKRLRAKGFFRVMFYMPYVIPFVAGIFAWSIMLNPETGWINQGLEALGWQNPPAWLNDPTWVYPGLVVLGLWGIGSAVIINLAGLQGIPTELYDAAKVDGAGPWATLWNVTLPMMSPVLFYSLVLGLVGVFQYFLVPLVLTEGTGRPGGATMFFNLYLYKTFFTFQNMSYGAAQAWLLFLVILVLTIFLFWSSKYWVHYAGESRQDT